MKLKYSVIHLGFISKPILEITDDGFYFKNEFYTHNDIHRINVAEVKGQPNGFGVLLKNGKRILINATALKLNDKRPKTGFLSGTNQVFIELKDYFQNGTIPTGKV